MPWFKTDDDFPEHVKVDALERACAGSWELYAAARTLWHDLGCDCARRRTDGVFDLARAHRVVRLPPDVVIRALVPLVASGLLEDVGEGRYRYHDWADYQPTRAEVEEQRRAAAARQRKRRATLRCVVSQRDAAVTHGVTPGVTPPGQRRDTQRDTRRDTPSDTHGDARGDVRAPVTAPRPVPARPSSLRSDARTREEQEVGQPTPEESPAKTPARARTPTDEELKAQLPWAADMARIGAKRNGR